MNKFCITLFHCLNIKPKIIGDLSFYSSPVEIVLREIKFRLWQLAYKNFPNSRYGISTWANFMNTNTRTHHDKSFSRLIYECVNDLDERGVLENIKRLKIYESHMKSNKNHADALLFLASLEYHLKTGLEK
jgi:hypothetical protein